MWELSSNGSDNKENKHSINDVSNLNKNKQEPTEVENKTKTNNMDTGQTIDFNFGAVVASLGFKEKSRFHRSWLGSPSWST